MILFKTSRRNDLHWFIIFGIDVKLLTLKLIECCKDIVMNSSINMKGCFSNNINRNFIQ